MTRLCIASTLRETADETIAFVNYHQSIGIDHIVLHLDDPDDAAAAMLAGRKGVQVIRCDAAYWAKASPDGQRPDNLNHRQVINLNRAFHRTDCEWLIHIDGDEFLYPETDMHSRFASARCDVLRFTLLEAAPTDATHRLFHELSLFRRQPRTHALGQMEQALRQGYRPGIERVQFFSGHENSKIAVRRTAAVQELAIHRVLVPKMVEEACMDISLLHFDAATFPRWREKWQRRVDASAPPRLNPGQDQQLELFRKVAGDREREAALFRDYYVVTEENRRILLDLDLAREIRLPARLFATPGPETNKQARTDDDP